MAGSVRQLATQLPVVDGSADARRAAWLEMVRVVNLVGRRVVATINDHDLTMPQFDVLATLRFAEGVTQQELAGRLLVTKGNVVGVLDRLARLGWVERRPDPDDGRANRVYLTAAGRRKLAGVIPAHDAVVLHAMRTLADGDVRSLRDALRLLDESNGGEVDEARP